MNNGISIDYNGMAEAANQLEQQYQAMDDCITSIGNVIHGLPDIWTAETCDKYLSQYEELEPGLKETAQLISDMVEQMNKIVSNFQDTDSGMAGQM